MTDKKFFVEEIEVLTPEDIKDGKDEGTIWPAVTDPENTVTYECRNEDVAKELCEFMNEQEATIRQQAVRIYCQDKEIQKLQEQLNQIPKNIREVWIE